jgi:hypothetical protein
VLRQDKYCCIDCLIVCFGNTTVVYIYIYIGSAILLFYATSQNWHKKILSTNEPCSVLVSTTHSTTKYWIILKHDYWTVLNFVQYIHTHNISSMLRTPSIPNCKSLWLFLFIYFFTIYLDITYVYIHSKFYVAKKSKWLIIWNGVFKYDFSCI